jgi:hypothetical protein
MTSHVLQHQYEIGNLARHDVSETQRNEKGIVVDFRLPNAPIRRMQIARERWLCPESHQRRVQSDEVRKQLV